MSIRRAIAEWLAPDAFADQAELHRVRSDLSDLWWWCGEFEYVAIAAAWVRLNSQRRTSDWPKYHAMVMNRTGPIGALTDRIDGFREWLRRTPPEEVSKAVRAEATRKPDYTPVPGTEGA